jgi:hypothetical protein
MTEDLEHGILYAYTSECLNFWSPSLEILDVSEMDGLGLAHGESFRSYAFWLGRDSDELIELVAE